MEYSKILHAQRTFFETGETHSYEFRITQLKKLRQAFIDHEAEIYAALFQDLGKNKAEAYASEYGFALAELNFHIKKLKSWMKPRRVSTNLLNFPSSTKMYHDPLGIILIIAPWNYPFHLTMVSLIGAISGGNCTVLKPSELAPATEAIIEKIIINNFTEQYISVFKGVGGEVVPALMNHFRFDHVFFTGSVPVGKSVYEMAAKQLVPVTLELGGKSPTVIHADANLKNAAQRIAIGKWINAGQTCIAPDYLLIEESIKDSFIKELRNTINSFYGDASQSKDYGRIINMKRFDKLVSYLTNGNTLHGGTYDQSSLFIAPTIIDQVPLDAPVMKEEIFGPILPILTFKRKEEALQIIQRNSHPLAFYVFTNDSKTEQWWLQHVPFGGGCINNTVYHFTNNKVPFGGIGNSGIGSYHGKHSFYTFTHAKPLLKTPNWFEPRFKYPPFDKKSLKLFRYIIK